MILRFVQRYKYPHTKFVLQAIVHHTVEIATDHYGLRVLKAVVEAGPPQRLHDVFEALTRQTTVLVENQYGNYIVQVRVAPRSRFGDRCTDLYVVTPRKTDSAHCIREVKCQRRCGKKHAYSHSSLSRVKQENDGVYAQELLLQIAWESVCECGGHQS